MHAVVVEIVRFVDGHPPGFVECVLRAADGRERVLRDKLPVFTAADLWEDSSYPQPGGVACVIVRQWVDENGRQRCLIDTSEPWGVQAVDGETQFEVFASEVFDCDGAAGEKG